MNSIRYKLRNRYRYIGILHAVKLHAVLYINHISTIHLISVVLSLSVVSVETTSRLLLTLGIESRSGGKSSLLKGSRDNVFRQGQVSAKVFNTLGS